MTNPNPRNPEKFEITLEEIDEAIASAKRFGDLFSIFLPELEHIREKIVRAARQN